VLARADSDVEREAAARLDEIHQYLRDRYARREVVARTTTRFGQDIDWVPAESQTTSGLLAERPQIAALEDLHVDPDRVTYSIPFDLAGTHAAAALPGTVPLVRLKVEQLRPMGDLEDWLAKGSRPKLLAPPDATAWPAPGDPIHKYATAVQPVTCFGTEGVINTWKPYVEWSNEFSLGQLWLSRGTGINHQTIEVGAITYKDLNSDWEAPPLHFLHYKRLHKNGSEARWLQH
jgi:hypothetical protein